ncbi:MAG: DnaJ domain-containing protein [Armatimonadetes bacterium]|nr:DnaJ domain-containing protein [Armatimonadota bacterium]
MAVKRDYYKILGVAPTATSDEIRKAYRMLSKKYHPDLNPDLKLYSDEKMKELVEAYNILNNPDKRKEYDRQPQFLVKKTKKSAASSVNPADYAKKPTYQRESSLLERIFSPFMKADKNQTPAAHLDPKQADIHFILGLSMAENEAFYEQARDEFRLAIKFMPQFPEALYNLGLMCYKRGMFEEAIITFQKVLALSKDDQMAYKMINLLGEDF